MYKVLLKKQLTELMLGPANKNKKSKLASKLPAIGYVFVYLLVFFSFASVFYLLSSSLCVPLVNSGLDWLYLAYMFLLSVVVCMVGTVFNCYAVLYKAKDNDLLLAMPIKPITILAARLTGEYLISLFFSLMVMGPAVINLVNCITLSGCQIITLIIMILMIPVIGLVLSAMLAFIVAAITSHIKTNHTTLLIVILSIGAIALYYYGIYRAEEVLATILSDSLLLGEEIEGSGNLLYILGAGMAGDIKYLLIIVLIVIALFSLLCFILAKSFYRLATANKGGVKVEYKEKAVRQAGTEAALLRKEIGKFFSSANYILNGAMVSFILIIGAVVIVFKKAAVQEALANVTANLPEGMVAEDTLALIICMIMAMVMGTTNITPCSVSLERDNLWILKSFPIDSWQVLKQKVAAGLLITGPAALIGVAGACYAAEPGIKNVIILVAFVILFSLFVNMAGLMFGLIFPKLNWTNETAAIKQSISVVITMGAGFILTLLMFVVFATNIIPAATTLLVVLGLLLVLDTGVYFWLKKKGTIRFERLGSE